MIRGKKLFNHKPLISDEDDAAIDSPDFLKKVENKQFFRCVANNDSIKFKNDFIRQVYYLAKLGARTCDIAAFFGVGENTVNNWQAKDPDFATAMMEGKWVFDMKVAETLGQRAMGYDYEEIEHSQHLTRGGEIKMLKKITKKHMPPDITAIICWLKNRQKELWADVNRNEIQSNVSFDITHKMDLSILTPEEQALVKSIAIKKIIPIHGVSNN